MKNLLLFVCLLCTGMLGWTQAQETKTIMVGGENVEMVRVEGGSFMMGCEPEMRTVGRTDEVPRHAVTLGSFYLGRYEVTQRLWETIMGYNPSNYVGPDLPVEQVSYTEALEFIARLNNITGMTFRLPTEAEWEYAARGGLESSGTVFAGRKDHTQVAWSRINSGDSTHAVGELVPNELGLYDMTGNVWEWCSDWYENMAYLWQQAYALGCPVHIATLPQLEVWAKLNNYEIVNGEILNEEGSCYGSVDNRLQYLAATRETDNPQGPKDGFYRVGRGGSWADEEKDLRIAYRNFWPPDRKISNLGFRLALSADTPSQKSSCWMPNQYVVDSVVGDSIYISHTTATQNEMEAARKRMEKGVLEGVFSVSDTTRVRFSRGNLQYNAVTHKWRFASKQYYRIGLDNVDFDAKYAGWTDLFPWATSGYHDHWPEDNVANSEHLGNGLRNLDHTSYDWGVHNPIENGGDREGQWRTLSVYEWHYLFAGRRNAQHLRCMAQVERVQGIILLPDDWLARGLDTLRPSVAYLIDHQQWARMERLGAVFLPATGYFRLNAYYLGELVTYDEPIEGYNVPFGVLVPKSSLSAAAPAFLEGEEVLTPMEQAYFQLASYRPPIENDYEIGRYWTTIHWDRQTALCLNFSYKQDLYIAPTQRADRLAVRLVQDCE